MVASAGTGARTGLLTCRVLIAATCTHFAVVNGGALGAIASEAGLACAVVGARASLGANGTHTTATEASLASVDLDTVAADTRARVALGANATAAASSSPFARSQARATAIQCSAKINRIARFAIAKVTSVTRAGFRARSNNSAHSLRSAALGFAGINWLAFRAAPSIFFCHVCGGNRETIWAPAHAI